MEKRYNSSLNIDQRAGELPTISGTASPYYDGTPATEYQLWDGVIERVLPGAFDESLQRGDSVLCCVDHNRQRRLGRTPTSLKLWTDARGLHYVCPPLDSQTYRETVAEIRAGVLLGSSYSFTPDKVQWKREDGKDIREIHSVTLHDVSPCVDPCNSKATSVTARSKDLDAEYTAWQETQRQIEYVDTLLRTL